MSSAAVYGLVLGTAMVILPRAFGEARGWLIVWTATGIQLGVGAVVVWQRTRLPRMTAAFALGAIASAIFAGLAALGVRLSDVLLDYPVVIAPFLLLVPSLMFSEAWFSKEKWNAVKRQAEESTLRDMFLFRHIPNLRAGIGPR